MEAEEENLPAGQRSLEGENPYVSLPPYVVGTSIKKFSVVAGHAYPLGHMPQEKVDVYEDVMLLSNTIVDTITTDPMGQQNPG